MITHISFSIHYFLFTNQRTNKKHKYYNLDGFVKDLDVSQHTIGEAADIHVPLNAYSDWDDNKRHTNMDLAKQWFDFLEHHTDFDQLIMETSNGRDYWIHVSCRKNAKKNRHQIFRDMRKPALSKVEGK